jgi:hypothetical protein
MSATRGNRSARLAEAKRAAESLTDDAVVSKVDAKRARASVAGDHDETDTVELVASATEPYSGSEAAETPSPVTVILLASAFREVCRDLTRFLWHRRLL